MIHHKGDIPERSAVHPPNFGNGDPKVSLVDDIVSSGGVAHVYCKSINRAPDDQVDAEDIHVYDYNSHRFTDRGILYVLLEDEEYWIFGDDIGAVERHYE